MFRRRVRKGAKITLTVLITCALLVVLANVWVVNSTSDKVYTNTETLPAHEVAVVLGTSARLGKGQPNPFFEYRIKTAAELYHAGKVKYFIVSGDNRTK